MTWRKVLGSDLDAREWLLAKIHLHEAFWMLPSFDDELWVYSKNDSFVLFRSPSSLRREFVASDDSEVNLEAIKLLKELELDTSSFFCAQDIGLLGKTASVQRWATMLEPTPRERVRSKKEHGMEALSSFKLLAKPALKGDLHSGYPEPLPVFYYELDQG